VRRGRGSWTDRIGLRRGGFRKVQRTPYTSGVTSSTGPIASSSSDLPEAFSVVILAGGYGKRLGQDKASAPVGGRPMLQWTAEAVASLSDDVIVVRRVGQALPPAPAGVTWREVTDRRSAAGPLAGIEAALHEIRHDLMVTVACDMPLVRPSLVRAIAAECAGVDVTMPVLDGVAQPLLAAYRRGCLPAIERLLSAGEGRIRAMLPEVPSRRLGKVDLERHDAGLLSFTNVNYPEDVARVAALLLRGHRGD